MAIPSDFDPPIVVPRALHSQGRVALDGALLVLQAARDALSVAELELVRVGRVVAERGGPLDSTRDALKAVRDAQAELAKRLGAFREYARDFRACDQDLTPVRSPSQSAVQAFRASSQFRAVTGREPGEGSK